nr:MAG TPA: hypothetical protein [Caudoviricetes sp.]
MPYYKTLPLAGPTKRLCPFAGRIRNEVIRH